MIWNREFGFDSENGRGDLNRVDVLRMELQQKSMVEEELAYLLPLYTLQQAHDCAGTSFL
jgi:hypothetical protein